MLNFKMSIDAHMMILTIIADIEDKTNELVNTALYCLNGPKLKRSEKWQTLLNQFVVKESI